ncbi:hypothetical protein ES332_D06G172700v1 [Gossypium tomentosum]|uniref:Uncharacterized protein n=1 Tax=Gossypium tomentosum TaxID=34277 RepID=A0A5D2KJ88_GOSTO|nr:hypothetical protein ES332_D06G172700v1 [Gossypium tomentosum]
MGMILDVPTTVAAVKNPTSKIVYDEYNHKRFPPGDPSKRAFAYFVLFGGMFVLSMSASRDILALASFEVNLSSIELGSTGDILALASLEVNLSSIELGSTVTVKW